MQYVEIFDEKLLVEKTNKQAIYRIYENQLFHAIFKTGELINMDTILEAKQFIIDNTSNPCYNIFQFEEYTEIEPDVREWSASANNNQYTIADAIVVSGLAQKIIADYYLHINKPIKPTQIFNSLSTAYQWINVIRK